MISQQILTLEGHGRFKGRNRAPDFVPMCDAVPARMELKNAVRPRVAAVPRAQ
jgi:hypothetical protein